MILLVQFSKQIITSDEYVFVVICGDCVTVTTAVIDRLTFLVVSNDRTNSCQKHILVIQAYSYNNFLSLYEELFIPFSVTITKHDHPPSKIFEAGYIANI